MLSWRAGALECRVIAAAGQFILLRPQRPPGAAIIPDGACSLTYLDGMVPVGWDGFVEPGAADGELRFRVRDAARSADRRSSVRVPVSGPVQVNTGTEVVDGQLLDVSAGGLRMRHRGRLVTGTPVRVRAPLADGMLIDADGVVRLSEPGVAAIEFRVMHGTDAGTIGAWAVGVIRASLAGQG